MKDKIKQILQENGVLLDKFKFISRDKIYSSAYIDEVWIYKKNQKRILKKIVVYPDGTEKAIYEKIWVDVIIDETILNDNDTLDLIIKQLKQLQEI
jgi:hypothetical protein